MTSTLPKSERWAAFRFSVVGPLYAARPDHGELRPALEKLSCQKFTHPTTGAPVSFAYSTVERWFYRAVGDGDPLHELRRRVRKDAGEFKAVSLELREAIRNLYQDHPTWSYQLHYENLDAMVDKRPELGPLPSYTTVRRYMRAQGYVRQKRRTDHRVHHSPREVRSYEMADAHALWHLDFHHGKRRVLLPNGEYVKPYLLAVLDDHSRIVCHAQWYLGETAEHLVHGLCQAFLKRGLPRAILMDNGAAMVAAEVVQGLPRLGILCRNTLPESPYQNGKQETFFAPIEGKCLSMLEGVRDLSLDQLNRATIAWVEQDYQRRHHEGIGETPLD
jgi:transposase InsO family protein